MKLDKIDRKLLHELDWNARQPLSRIAKKLRISRNVLLYRFNRLKKEGVITGSFTEINMLALGYFSFRVFIKIGNYTTTQKQQLVDFILSQNNLLWFSEVLGKWDLDLVYICKDVFVFEEFRKELFLLFNYIFEETHISLLTQVYHHPKDYLIEKKRGRKVPTRILNSEKVDLDEKDTRILFAIAGNSMMPLLKMAKYTRMSVNTVKTRLKKLEKAKIILGYRLGMNPHTLGYFYYKLHITLRHYCEKEWNALRSFLESKNFMIYTNHYISGEDFEIELHLKREEDYLAFVDELYEQFGTVIKDHFVLKFTKEYLFRYLPEH